MTITAAAMTMLEPAVLHPALKFTAVRENGPAIQNQNNLFVRGLFAAYASNHKSACERICLVNTGPR